MARRVFCIRTLIAVWDARDRLEDIVFMHFLASRSFDFFVIQFLAFGDTSFERFLEGKIVFWQLKGRVPDSFDFVYNTLVSVTKF